eukprot:Platyproteum_vivax@DN6233_c0_g1_i2.p1
MRLSGGRRILLSVGLCSAAGVAAASQVESIRRNTYFWVKAYPCYLSYRVVQWYVKGKPWEEAVKYYWPLHDICAPIMFDLLVNLKGFYIKIGQLGATRADYLPPQYLERCTRLQDQCPHYDLDYIKKIIEKDYGCAWSEVFSDIEPVPLGAASIGQAHKAKLLTGEDVVVKVQFPNAERQFRVDIQTLKKFCAIAQPAHLPFLKEIEKQFLTEFDYRKEAGNLRAVRDRVLPVWKRWVEIPEPVEHLCTKNVLVMEFIPGPKLAEAIKAQYTRVATERGLTLQQLTHEQREKSRQARAEGKVSKPAGVWAYKAWQLQVAAQTAVHNVVTGLYTVSLWPLLYATGVDKKTPQFKSFQTSVPLNVPQILQTLIEVHGHEMLVDGCFNGDPHPGNILMMPDGRLGLIDYGQVKFITPDQQLQLARLIDALAVNNLEVAARIFSDDIGVKTTYKDPWALQSRALMCIDRDDTTILGGLNVQQFFEKLDTVDPVVSMPDDYVMAFRLSLLLRGMGYVLGYPVSTAKAWHKLALKVVKDHNVEPTPPMDVPAPEPVMHIPTTDNPNLKIRKLKYND